MIACPDCGAANPDGREFCATCAGYLWDRDTTPPDPSPPKPTTDPPARGTDGGSSPPATATATDPDQPGPAPTHRDGPDAVPPGPDSGQPGSGAGEPGPGAGQPGPDAVQPGPAPVRRDKPDAVQPGPPTPTPGPVDPVPPVDPEPDPPRAGPTCGHCGTDNPPDRRICRSCGQPLTAPQRSAPERRTWWQRMLDRLRRRPARSDRRAVRATRRLLLIVLGLCLLAVLAVAGPPLARRAVEAVRDRTQKPVPLVPATVTASSELPEGRAARLTDGLNNRYWAPSGQPVGAWVEGRFTEPVRLLTMFVTPGTGTRQDDFRSTGRPRGLTVLTVDAAGAERKTEIELRDEPGPQQFTVEASDVVRIRLVVRSTYGPGLVPAVAIAEAEFFGRR